MFSLKRLYNPTGLIMMAFGLILTACAPRDELILPADPDALIAVINPRIFAQWKRKLKNRNISVYGYLVFKEDEGAFLLFSNKENSEKADWRKHPKQFVRVPSTAKDGNAYNAPHNCINQNVSLFGHVGRLKSGSGIGIDKIYILSVRRDTSTDFNEVPCYFGPDYTPSPHMVISTKVLLGKLGFTPGKPDGYMNSTVQKAILAYQGEHGLPLTGMTNDVLLVDLSKEVVARIHSNAAGRKITAKP